ncbi:MAG: hypothetical protein J6P34_04825 [Paludibacteraceae bacterium]|nr:hypothetical protein [Paludibacteraceae bacterium]
MKRLYIPSWMTAVLALIGYIVMCNNGDGGSFLLQFGAIASSTFCLINAFWLISKRKFAAGACMYGVLLQNLYIMFYLLGYEGYMPMLYASLGFEALAAIARYFEVKIGKSKGVNVNIFDIPVCYALIMLAISVIVLFL